MRVPKRAAALLLLAAVCATLPGCRTPGAKPIGKAIDSNVQFSLRVPDVADYAAAELATAALNSDLPKATRMLKRLRAIDTVLVADGDEPTGLVPVATDLVNATMDAPRVYRNATQALLARDDLDPALRARLSQTEKDVPLALAEDRINDARMISFARAFNTLAEPVGQSITSLAMAPYRIGRSVLGYAVQLYEKEPLSLQRRQALAHWKEFVARYPDAPESDRLRLQIERAEVKLDRTLRDRAYNAAERALDFGNERLALVYADRALGYVPEDADATEIRDLAEEQILIDRANGYRSLQSPPDPGELSSDVRALAIALLEPNSDAAEALLRFRETSDDPTMTDEADFVEAVLAGDSGREIEMWDQLEDLGDDTESNMSRHANAMVRSPFQNSFDAFETAKSLSRKHRAMWVAVGQWMRGPRDRGMIRPLEWMIDFPAMLQSVVAAPLRLIQLPFMDVLPAEKLASVFARKYLARRPAGEHSREVRDWLSKFEKGRKNWIGAYQLAEQDPERDDEGVAELREKAAEQAVEIASRETRRDLRSAKYRQVAQQYTDTVAGEQAGTLAREEFIQSTPQQVAISRGFLTENRDFAGPLGLGLDPHLLDDDSSNGELHPSGVILIGGRAVELHFLAASGDDDDPPTIVYQQLSEERFTRLIAKLEETSFRNALIDPDERLGADASRDVFFERARVGLVENIDSRALASSDYAYQGMRERYGMVRARESILPFDLVIQGSLTDLSLGAFPRIRNPRNTPDAFLFR
jgi:hypothetical protein